MSKLTGDRLVKMAQEAGMLVATELKWQQDRWDALAEILNNEVRIYWNDPSVNRRKTDKPIVEISL